MKVKLSYTVDLKSIPAECYRILESDYFKMCSTQSKELKEVRSYLIESGNQEHERALAALSAIRASLHDFYGRVEEIEEILKQISSFEKQESPSVENE